MRFSPEKSGSYKVAMAFCINIYECQLYPKHGHLSVNQLKNDIWPFYHNINSESFLYFIHLSIQSPCKDFGIAIRVP